MKKKLENVVPMVQAQYILRTIAKSTGMNLCIMDLLGKMLIPSTNDTNFCREVHKDPKKKEVCLWCASHAALEAAQRRRPFFYRCPYGLIDFALPIFFHSDVLGMILGGELKIDDCEDRLDYSYAPIPIDKELQTYYDEIRVSNFDNVMHTAELLSQIADSLENLTVLMRTKKSALNNQEHLKKLQPALDFIDINYNTNFSLKDVAAICCVSEAYMSRMFRATMKCSLTQYVTKLRIEKAKELLADSHQKMLAIAYEVGYYDCAHFSRKFKEETGMTPSEYRIYITK